MGIFDRFPYSSTHEMNLDFMLGKATEIAESLQEIDTHKEQAEQAAQAAQSAQTAAQAAQTAAQTSAGQAAQHKTDAEDAADRAEAASTEAEEAAEQAQTAAQTAGTAAQNASTAADGAIASATAAETRINNLAASLPSDFTDLNNRVGILKNIALPNDILNYEHGENLYNYYNIIRNKYINPKTGAITDIQYPSFAYSPTYIPVSAGEILTATDRVIIAYYDAWYNVLSALQMDTSKQTTVPSGAVYARFSVSSPDHTTVKIVKGESIGASVGMYSYTLKGLTTDTNDEIIVDINGNGNYTSLTQAVYENVDNGKTIEVMPGEYDVKAEYIALFGQTVIDNLSDATSGINNFQYGIRIHDRKVVFMPGSKVVCDWTGKTIDSTHRFCAFRIEQGAEIEGLYLVCTATFYGIHDDYGPETPFTIKYKNCRIECYNIYNANCIGGGCHKYSRHIIENCYFNNHVTSTDIVLAADVRYHNTSAANAEPEVFISNCFFSNNFNAAYYGNQTTKMKVYVNNCHAPQGINKVRESSTMNVDNVDLYKWNNEESA